MSGRFMLSLLAGLLSMGLVACKDTQKAIEKDDKETARRPLEETRTSEPDLKSSDEKSSAVSAEKTVASEKSEAAKSPEKSAPVEEPKNVGKVSISVVVFVDPVALKNGTITTKHATILAEKVKEGLASLKSDSYDVQVQSDQDALAQKIKELKLADINELTQFSATMCLENRAMYAVSIKPVYSESRETVAGEDTQYVFLDAQIQAVEAGTNRVAASATTTSPVQRMVVGSPDRARDQLYLAGGEKCKALLLKAFKADLDDQVQKGFRYTLQVKGLGDANKEIKLQDAVKKMAGVTESEKDRSGDGVVFFKVRYRGKLDDFEKEFQKSVAKDMGMTKVITLPKETAWKKE